MADKFTTKQRSEIMSAVRSRGNRSTEAVFVSLLRKHKITGWRRHYPVKGTPDFVFPKEKIAIFIDGCFWHKCPRCYRRPKSNRKYWDQKVEDNWRRDTNTRRKLRNGGWCVIRIWEHELKNDSQDVVKKKLQKVIA